MGLCCVEPFLAFLGGVGAEGARGAGAEATDETEPGLDVTLDLGAGRFRDDPPLRCVDLGGSSSKTAVGFPPRSPFSDALKT